MMIVWHPNSLKVTHLDYKPWLKVNIVMFYFYFEGLGPIFKIKCTIENIGGDIISEVFITYSFDDKLFQLLNAPFKLNYLIPKTPYSFEFAV
jgi:hypothetical protein